MFQRIRTISSKLAYDNLWPCLQWCDVGRNSVAENDSFDTKLQPCSLCFCVRKVCHLFLRNFSIWTELCTSYSHLEFTECFHRISFQLLERQRIVLGRYHMAS